MWKTAFFILLFLIVIATVSVMAYRAGKSGLPNSTPSPSPTVSSLTSPIPKASLIPSSASPSPSPQADDATLIKQAIYAKTGLNQTQAEVTISQNTGTHAKGNIREYEAPGGAYWLAAKTSGGWVAVYDGQAHPTCAQIAPYNFPTSMVAECLDASGNVISR